MHGRVCIGRNVGHVLQTSKMVHMAEVTAEDNDYQPTGVRWYVMRGKNRVHQWRDSKTPDMRTRKVTHCSVVEQLSKEIEEMAWALLMKMVTSAAVEEQSSREEETLSTAWKEE